MTIVFSIRGVICILEVTLTVYGFEIFKKGQFPIKNYLFHLFRRFKYVSTLY